MSEADEFIISKLETGFLVRERGHRDHPCAALTSFDDLVGWLRIRFGVEDEARHHKAVLDNLFAAKERRSDRVEITSITTDGAPTTVQVRPTPTPAPVGDGVTADNDAIEALRDQLAEKMGDARADPASLASDPGSGPGQAPAGDTPKTERDRIIAGLTPNQAKVFDFLQLTQMGHDGWFAMTRTAIATAAGLRSDTVPPVIGALEARKLIAVKRQGKGNPVLYRVDLPEDGDDGEA